MAENSEGTASVTKRKVEDDEASTSKKSKGTTEEFSQIYNRLPCSDMRFWFRPDTCVQPSS